MTNAHPQTPIGSHFETVVAVRIDGHWHFVESAEQAFRCLSDAFAMTGGASYVRALETCDLFRNERIGADGVQAAFIVAAMACGYPYEILERDEALLERMVVAAAEEAVLMALP